MEGWGDAAGSAVAGIVNSLSQIVTQASQVASSVLEKWRNEDWAGLGAMIGKAIWDGVKSVIGSLGSLFSNFKLPTFGSVVGGMMNGPGGAKPAVPTPSVPISGARARGGPVKAGRLYVVNERGPELFMPGMSGRIESNDRLRRLTADGTTMLGGLTSSSSTRTYTLNPTINIMGGENPREIAGQVRSEMRRFLAELEAEQRGFLSD